MDPNILQWLTLIVVFALAVISPGPDFVVSVRNSILYSRRAGVLTAFGFALGTMVHATYTMLGIAALIAQSVLLFSLLKWAGAAYLLYIGYHALRSKGVGQEALDEATKIPVAQVRKMTDFQAFRSGLLTNLLNPKATLFFLAIFSQIIAPGTPDLWKAVYALTCGVMTALWFSIVALVLTHGPLRAMFVRAAKWIDRTCGALLIGLGLKVASTSL